MGQRNGKNQDFHTLSNFNLLGMTTFEAIFFYMGFEYEPHSFFFIMMGQKVLVFISLN